MIATEIYTGSHAEVLALGACAQAIKDGNAFSASPDPSGGWSVSITAPPETNPFPYPESV